MKMMNAFKQLDAEKYSSDVSEGGDSIEEIENTTTSFDRLSTMSFSGDASDSRDEVAEIQKASSKDTRRVQMWRLAVLLALVVTGVTVTLSTYRNLKKAEQENFETAVSVSSLCPTAAALKIEALTCLCRFSPV